MYPQGALTDLAATKTALRARIAAERAACTQHTAIVLRPVGWLDLAVDLWRQTPLLGRLAAIPLGILAARKIRNDSGILSRCLRWGSFIYGVLRQFNPR